MKKILLISLLGFITLSISACDNKKNDQPANQTQAENQVENDMSGFKSNYLKSCVNEGPTLSFCECTYSELTKKYSEKEMISIYTSKNQNAKSELHNDMQDSVKKCLN